MAFYYKKPRMKWHKIYISVLNIVGILSLLYSIFYYIVAFSQLFGKNLPAWGSYYLDEEAKFKIILLYLTMLIIDAIKIILEFTTSKILREFSASGDTLNNVLHVAICISLFLKGGLYGGTYIDSGKFFWLLGLSSSAIWGILIWLPIFIYYYRRHGLFDIDYPDREKHLILLNVPQTIIDGCKNNSTDSVIFNTYIDDCLSDGLITSVQAKTLRNLFEEEIENSEEPHLNSPTPIYCRKCGSKLMPDSLYCDKCGTKIVIFV